MKALSEMVKEYKENPSEELKNDIMDFLVSAVNPEELDRLRRNSEGEWRVFENKKFKHLYGKCYAVAEEFGLNDGYMCYAYKIDLSAYSENEIRAYEQSCIEYKNTVDSDEMFSVFAVASAFDVDDAQLCDFIQSEEKDLWYAKVDREVK